MTSTFEKTDFDLDKLWSLFVLYAREMYTNNFHKYINLSEEYFYKIIYKFFLYKYF